MAADKSASETSATNPSDQPEMDLTPAQPAKKVLPSTMAPAVLEVADEENDEKTESI